MTRITHRRSRVIAASSTLLSLIACGTDDPIAPPIATLAPTLDVQMTITTTDLGPLGDGGWVESGLGINDRGEVVGRGFDGQKAVAYVWSKQGGARVLGGIDGYAFAQSNDINNRGDVIGYVQPQSNAASHVRFWVRGTEGIDLSPSVALHALNNRGQAVGSSEGRAIVWTVRDGIRYLEQPAGATAASAYDINEGGDIVGAITPFIGSSPGATAAAIWPKGGSPERAIPPPGPNPPSFATAINNEGVFVGYWGERLIDGRGFVGGPGVGFRMLETPIGWASHPAAINERGDIVGSIFSPLTGTRAVMWTSEGTLVELGVGSASDINNRGQIVGWVLTDLPPGSMGNVRGVLWTVNQVVDAEK